MKQIIAIASSCLLSAITLTNLAAQEKEKDKDNEKRIEGSGNVITRDVAVQSFSELSVSGVFHLVLIQGSKEGVKIEADDNLQDLFEVKNEGSKLIVGMKKDSHFNSKKKMNVTITFKQLKSMDMKMVGDVTQEGNMSFGDLAMGNKSVGNVTLSFNAQKLDLDNKSVGNLNLSGKVDNAVINNKGVGQLKATDLVVQSMDISNDGVGSAEVNAVKELKVKDSFLGKVKNVGAATVKKKVVI